jgi:HlyD family secretion protein
MRMTKRRWGVVAIGAGVLAAAGWALVPNPVDVEVVKVSRGPLTVSMSEDGITRVRERYEVAAPVAGRLLRVVVHPGDSVDPDTPLLHVQPSPLDPKSEAQLTARLSSAGQSEREADAMLLRARDAHARATTEAGRIRKLAAQSIVSQDALDAANTNESIAAKDLAAARFRSEAAKYEVQVARAALNAYDERGVPREIVVRSPVCGRVLQVLHESESVVTAGTPLVTIGDCGDLEAVADFLTADAVKIRPGARALIERWGGPNALEARVRLIEPAAFTKVSALGVEEQRVNVVADFVDPPRVLGDQYRVDMRVIAWDGVATKVPATAVFTSGGGSKIFAISGGRARLRPVSIGHAGETEVEIVSGLEPGDEVILHPSDQVRDGVRVRARK